MKNGTKLLSFIAFTITGIALVIIRPLFIPIWALSEPLPEPYWRVWYPMLVEKNYRWKVVFLRVVERKYWSSGSSSETADSGVYYIINGEKWA